jgi:hypothetical protein
MFERLDKLREEVKRCEKRRDEANERLKAAQAKLKEAEASQILSDVGALKLSPEEVARLLQMAASGQLAVPGVTGTSSAVASKESPIYTGTSKTDSITDDDFDDNKEDEDDENY